MKKIYIFSVLFFTFITSYAHDGEIHKYIVYRAYQMLERRYVEAGGNIQDLSEIKSKILYPDGSQCNEDNNKNYPIVRGAFIEDESDPIYYYLTQTTTFTHFWKADDGDNQRNWLINSPNALMKANAYMFSYEKSYTWKSVEKYTPFYLKTYVYSIPTSLTNFYANGQCLRKKIAITIGGIEILLDTETVFYSDHKRLSYEILGRIAHLLADMSVPAHDHIDSHPALLGDPDYYEHSFITQNVNNTNYLIDDDGLMPFLVNNYNDFQVLRSLFYTMNQITSHFASDDFSGNNYLPTSTTHIDQKFTAWGSAVSHPASDFPDITEKTFNFCIGATATLFYWFGIKTGMLKTRINDLYLTQSSRNPTMYIHADNSINLLPGFEFSGNEMILTTDPTSSRRPSPYYVPPASVPAPNTDFTLDSIPQNIPIDTIYISNP